MKGLHAPWRKHHLSVHVFFMSFRQLHFKVWGLIYSGPEIEPVSALASLVFGCFVKTESNMGGNNREYIWKILSKRAHGVGICLWYFSAGEMTLWAMNRQPMHSSAKVSMTTKLLTGCNLSHFLLQSQVYANLRGGLVSLFMLLLILSCVSSTRFPIRLHNLNLSFVAYY